jgi:hypothetical protein
VGRAVVRCCAGIVSIYGKTVNKVDIEKPLGEVVYFDLLFFFVQGGSTRSNKKRKKKWITQPDQKSERKYLK